jgi:hypothetical protein
MDTNFAPTTQQQSFLDTLRTTSTNIALIARAFKRSAAPRASGTGCSPRCGRRGRS